MASRNLTAALQAEFKKNQLSLIALVQIEFVSATEYLWSGYGNLSWNSQTWKGLGTLAGISTITESSDIQANGITLSLSGIPTDMLNYCLSEIRPDKKVKVWYGALDNNGQVIVDPYLAFQGFCDVPSFEDNAETCTINLTVEPRWLDRRPRVWRLTDKDQQILHPGDTALRFLKDLDKPLYWGNGPVEQLPTYGGGCFTYGVGIKTPIGFFPIGSLPRSHDFAVENKTGTHRALLIVHENYKGWMLKLGDGLLVTIDHPMGTDGSIPAENFYGGLERVWFEGTVYTLRVLSEDPADKHYILFNGDAAHNKNDPVGYREEVGT